MRQRKRRTIPLRKSQTNCVSERRLQPNLNFKKHGQSGG